MNLDWEIPSEGKKKALKKVLEPKENFKSVWVKAYRDVCTIIQERDDSEQFK